MGCGSAREKLEDQMRIYKLERMERQSNMGCGTSGIYA